jgi:phosphohistidine swiveling domain-containing protein
MKYIKKLSELDRNDLSLAGGKGANLGALITANLPVPPGFCITIEAYRHYIEANGLKSRIRDRLNEVQLDCLSDLEAISDDIRILFEAGTLPVEVIDDVKAAYKDLLPQMAGLPGAVAVRSSATAEDLPELSFAGQQDTYLNVVGEANILQAVVRCWASLWTARAIGYRARNHVAQAEIALAVVVQVMVPSEVSGVLFTCNPLTGKRSEMVIDAALGLGEALVSGMVNPDQYIVEVDSNRESQAQILKVTLGAKAHSVRGMNDGGTQVVSESGAGLQALPDHQILELAHLGAQIADCFGFPQDIEWAWAQERLFILQSRPVTTLYPLPEKLAANPLEVLLSFGAWQGMLDPISPLGQDVFTSLVMGLGHHFGVQVGLQDQRVLFNAGERLFVNLTGLIRSPTGRKILTAFIAAVDPVSDEVIRDLRQDRRLSLLPQQISLARRLRILLGLSPIIKGVVFNLLWPARGRERLAHKVDEVISRLRQQCEGTVGLPTLVGVLEDMALSTPALPLLPYLLPGVIAGQAPLQILIRLANRVPDGPRLALELTRGLPHNVTTKMDLKLWTASRVIQADPVARKYLLETEADRLAADYLEQKLPPVAQQEAKKFLQVYGARGVGEIDLARPRWNDRPGHILQVLKSYLQIVDPSTSPEAVFTNGTARAQQAEIELAAAMRKTPLGRLKTHLVHALALRIRELCGLRETPKFAIVRMLGVLRTALLKVGNDLAVAGVLNQQDDIFFLHLWELKNLTEDRLPDLPLLIARRRQTYIREQARKQIPHILLSDGTVYYEASRPAAAGEVGVLTGSPVSAGVIEGLVHVMLDPYSAQLAPGEILVCPATDPAWTPLFLSAGGLVTEVGGMMTHGSVVAREYGIPAVVGVSQATNRLKTGQRIRLDGSSGLIIVLDD